LKIPTVRGIARTLSAVLSQAVEDEHLSANPALRLGKYLRRGDESKPQIDPFTRDEAAILVSTASVHFPEWHAWTLTAPRTGLRLGELLALQWVDLDWHGGYVQVQRSLVTPKNHQCRRVDLSRPLRVALRLWRRRKSAEWLKLGQPRPVWVFSSVVGTPFDEANVRKAWGAIVEKGWATHRSRLRSISTAIWSPAATARQWTVWTTNRHPLHSRCTRPVSLPSVNPPDR